MQREIEFLKEDRELVQQFCSSGSVAIDGKTYNARCSTQLLEEHHLIAPDWKLSSEPRDKAC